MTILFPEFPTNLPFSFMNNNMWYYSRKWGFEKLVYKDVKRGIRRDRKYAVQPRNVFATGVHMSQNTVGKTTHKTEGRIMYYHYHGTIAERREPCRQMVNTSYLTVDGTPYALDTYMREVAGFVKRFELKVIGSTLQRTRQWKGRLFLVILDASSLERYKDI